MYFHYFVGGKFLLKFLLSPLQAWGHYHSINLINVIKSIKENNDLGEKIAYNFPIRKCFRDQRLVFLWDMKSINDLF